MNKKTRDQLDKHFGLGTMFNDKIKIPLCDVISASWIMGDMNSERFWTAKIELRVIILGAIIFGAYFYWQDHRRKQQERLNEIRLDKRD